MSFNFKSFLVDLAEIGPSIYSAVMSIKQEAPTATKVQLATDALNAATGVSAALLSSDPADQQLAATASQIASTVISTIHTTTPAPAVATS